MNIRHLILLLIILTTFDVEAQRNIAPPVDLNSPHNTMHVHLYYLQADSYDPSLAAETVSPKLDSLERVQAAIKIKQVFDGKGFFVYLNKVPTDANYYDSIVQQAVYTPFPEDLPAIYLEKEGGKWYYSQETALQIDDIFNEVYPFGTKFILNILPQWSTHSFLGMKIWKWIGLLGLILFVWLGSWLLSRIFRPLVSKQIMDRLVLIESNPKLKNQIAYVLSLLIMFFIANKLYPILQLPVHVASILRVGLLICIAVFTALLFYRLSRAVFIYLEQAAMRTDSKMDDQLLPVLERTVILLIVVITVFYCLSVLNVNVTAIIAGLSIGGLALALAAQDTVKHLIGSMMVFFDKPFQVGDFVEVNGVWGTVTEVGFRSTRILTKDTSIVSIPNGDVANAAVRNLGVRYFRLLDTEIALTYDTPTKYIKAYVEGIKAILKGHPEVVDEEQYVHFSAMADSSLNVMVRCYIRTTAWAEELRIKEELFLSFVDLANALNIRFAFPSTTLYIEDFPEKEPKIPHYEGDEKALEKAKDDFIKDWQEEKGK